MLVYISFVVLAFLATEISGGCDSRCEPLNAKFLEVFNEISPFTDPKFYENQLLQSIQNISIDAPNTDKIKAIDKQVDRINEQIQTAYITFAALIGSKLPDLTDLLLIESILAGDSQTVEFPYSCIFAELQNIALKLQFMLEDSVRFAEILKELACTRTPLNVTPSPSSGC